MYYTDRGLSSHNLADLTSKVHRRITGARGHVRLLFIRVRSADLLRSVIASELYDHLHTLDDIFSHVVRRVTSVRSVRPRVIIIPVDTTAVRSVRPRVIDSSSRSDFPTTRHTFRGNRIPVCCRPPILPAGHCRFPHATTAVPDAQVTAFQTAVGR